MKLEHLGDLALLVRGLDDPPAYARTLNCSRPLGLIEAVPAYDTLGLYFAESPDIEEIHRHFAELQLGVTEEGQHLDIPCVYDGPDLAEVAELTGLSPAEVINLHSGGEYRCYAVGFTPGFAYLGYLDDRLVLPRRSEPRRTVPAGSVAIAGRQTAVYPGASPGGWWLIGTSPMKLVDVEEGYFRIQPGDIVRFVH